MENYLMPFLIGLIVSLVLRSVLWLYVVYESQPTLDEKLKAAMLPNLGLCAIVMLLPSWLAPANDVQVYLLNYGFIGAFAGNLGAAILLAYSPRMTPDYHKKIWGTFPR